MKVLVSLGTFTFLTNLAIAQISVPLATSVTPPPSHGSGSCAGQEMYISTDTGVIYRIDNYATAPVAGDGAPTW